MRIITNRKSRFLQIYDKIILQSKNINIPNKLVQYIKNKFQYKNEIIIQDQLKQYKLINIDKILIFIINPNDTNNYNNQFIKKYKQQIKYQLSINYSISKIQNNIAYICLNYLILKDDNIQLESVIKHQLTHIFQYSKEDKKIWNDLIPFLPNVNLTKKEQIIFFTLSLYYNMTYRDIYYLTCGKQFQAFCTTIQYNKDKFDKNILKNLNKRIINNQLDNIQSKIVDLYIFIFLNINLDLTGQRKYYIKEHLF